MNKPHKRQRRTGYWDGGATTARITHYGALLFSKTAVHQFDLPKFSYCRLHFDRVRNTIGVELIAPSPQTDGDTAIPARARRIYTTPNSAYTMVTSLLGAYGIDLVIDVDCPVETEKHMDTDLLAVDLTPAIKAAAGRDKVIVPRRSKPKRDQNGATNGRR